MGIPNWFNKAIFYEIYPQSFQDTNGDGIGDLEGIIQRLDYIQSLNVNALWLNPCFESPFQDAGYDISDYRKIAPRYGTNDDMKRLCEEVHKRGMHIILDFVAGHTSIEHPWFKDALTKGEKSPYNHFYSWTSDWMENTGDYRFVNGYGPRDGYYMINFFYCQPALNYGFEPCDPDLPWQLPTDHPAVQKTRREMRDVMKFWLDLGCDGFRVDMAASLVKGTEGNKGVKALWREWRTWLEKEYPEAVLVAEWCNPADSIPAGFHSDFMTFGQKGYTRLLRSEKNRLSNDYANFDPTVPSFFGGRVEGAGDAKQFLDDLAGNLSATRGLGYPGIVTGNHDIGRCRGNDRTYEEMKQIYAFLLLLPGVPFLYYGDEIGMNNVHGLGNVEGSYNRSASRTPMQWTPDEKAGFSTAALEKFYLPLDPAADRPDVTTQEKDANSLLNFTRWLLQLRQDNPALKPDAGYRVLYCERNQVPVVYERFSGDSHVVVAVNPRQQTVQATVALPDAQDYKLLKGTDGAKLVAESGATTVVLPADSFAIWVK